LSGSQSRAGANHVTGRVFLMKEGESQSLKHYRILRRIGAGGMGEIHLAEDTRLGRKVALKLLPAEFSRDRDRLDRFQQEARAASALNHPNILTIYEIGTSAEGDFIATEFIEGETLRQHVVRAALDLDRVLDIAAQVSAGLAAAHEAGIVHRDIKPENIMIRSDGYVKILDFGLAKPVAQFASGGDSAATMARATTSPGIVMGTVNYMSPEQARGLAVDARTDIFSLGIVLYEMVSGRRPFERSTTTDTLAAVLNHEPPPLARFSPDVPAELQRIVTKAMAKKPQDRYQTAKDLHLDLRSLKLRLDFERELQREKSVGIVTTDAAQISESRAALRSNGEISIPPTASGAAQSLRRRKSRGAIDSIAVLPFDNASKDPQTEYLSDGITESIINSLSQLPKLRVLARSTVFRHKGSPQDPLEVGRQLQVRSILSGRVLQLGETIVIKAELVDTTDGSHIWGGQYKRQFEDVLSIEEEISAEISGQLRPKLTGEEKKRASKRFTHHPEAYQCYLRGRFHWNKRTAEDLKKGIECFQQAIAADPTYALAYSGLADAYALLAWFTTMACPPNDVMPKARAAATRALELDATLAEAHASLAMVKTLYEWDWAGAESEFRRAIELNPKYATGRQWHAILLIGSDRFPEAIEEISRALELDPLSLMINASLGWALYFARRFDEAVRQLQRTLDVEPLFYPAHLFLGYAYEARGEYDKAVASFAQAEKLNDTPAIRSALGHCHAVAGETEPALRALDRLNELSLQRYVSPESQGIISVGLGDLDRAFHYLGKAVEERSTYIPFLNADARLDPARLDPRFSGLLRRTRFRGQAP